MIAEASLLAQGHGELHFRIWGPLAGSVLVALVVLVVVCIYRAAEYFGSAKKEQKLLRMEVGKLAEEVYQIRQELKEIKGKDSPSRSE